jgi:hypothetical protein
MAILSGSPDNYYFATNNPILFRQYTYHTRGHPYTQFETYSFPLHHISAETGHRDVSKPTHVKKRLICTLLTLKYYDKNLIVLVYTMYVPIDAQKSLSTGSNSIKETGLGEGTNQRNRWQSPFSILEGFSMRPRATTGCVKPPTVKPVRNMVKLASPDIVKILCGYSVNQGQFHYCTMKAQGSGVMLILI